MSRLRWFLIRLVVVLLLTPVVANLIIYLWTGYVVVGTPSSRITLEQKLTVEIVAILLATFAVSFKHDLPSAYGITEFLFGATLFWYLLSYQLTENRYANTLALVAALYVMGRGLNNWLEREVKANYPNGIFFFRKEPPGDAPLPPALLPWYRRRNPSLPRTEWEKQFDVSREEADRRDTIDREERQRVAERLQEVQRQLERLEQQLERRDHPHLPE